MLEGKKLSYYYVKTISDDPMDTQYDGLYTFEGDWLAAFEDLISSDIDAYIYDITKWHSDERFEIKITGIDINQLPEDVKDSLVNIPYPITYVLKVSVTDERGKGEIYIFIPKN